MKKDFDNPEFISRKTKRGLLLLVFLCLLIIYVPRLYAYFQPADEVVLSQNEIEKIAELKVVYQNRKTQKQKKTFTKRVYRRPPRKFNPNHYSKAEWMYLGLSDKQADVMLKIAKKGIWTNAFLGKISVLPDEVFVLIKDSTFFEERTYPAKEYPKFNEKADVKSAIVELNAAAEEELITLRGIGPSFAKRIVAYRELLGGYTQKEQLLEVYNFGTDKYDLVDASVRVDASLVRKLNINTATVEEFNAHPYIKYNVANSLVKYRQQHGPYKRIEDIKKSQLIGEELYEKLKPYVYL